MSELEKEVSATTEAVTAEEVTGATEEKKVSKTDVYKQHLQKIIYQQLGIKISKDKAWEVFKAIMHGTVEHVLNLPIETAPVEEGSDEEGKSTRRLPLAGVGTFQILETKPRGSKAGLDREGNPIEGAVVWPCVPRFRFYPSTVVDKLVEQVYGLANHEIEVEHYGLYVPEVAEPVKEAKPAKEAKADPVVKASAEEKAAAEPVEDLLDEI